MGRASFLSVLVALLLAGTPAAARPASAASHASAEPAISAISGESAASAMSVESAAAARAAGCDGDLLTKLQCWRKQTEKGKRVEVSLSRPLPLDRSIDHVDWPLYQDAFRGDLFRVSVPGGHESGAGGTLLLILAGGRAQRLVAPDSKITTLPGSMVEVIRPDCDALCAAVDAAGTGRRTVPGKALIDNRLAVVLPAESGGSAWRVAFPVVLVLLLVLLGFTVLRTRRLRVATDLGAAGDPYAPYAPYPDGTRDARAARTVREADEAAGAHDHARGAPPGVAAPADRRRQSRRYGRQVDIPPGPRRTAVVRSDLHPQGYVEVDRCLFRAVWADHRAPAPGIGASVDVVQGAGPDSDILLALPPGAGPRH